MRKVFGIGLNKTGTTSLGECLKRLGYRHADYDELRASACLSGSMETVWACAENHDNAEDWPWPLLYRELAERYPDALFFLTVRRSPEVWLQSVTKHCRRISPWSDVGRRIYGCCYPENAPGRFLEMYERHNREAQAFLGERCRVICWENGDGWAEVCSFLGHTVPDEPFPWANGMPHIPIKAGTLNAIFSRTEALKLALGNAVGRPPPTGLLGRS